MIKRHFRITILFVLAVLLAVHLIGPQTTLGKQSGNQTASNLTMASPVPILGPQTTLGKQSGNQTASNLTMASPVPPGGPTVSKNPPLRTSTYIANKTLEVEPGKNVTTTAFCNPGDALVIGGYAVGSKSVLSVAHTVIYSNEPRGVPRFILKANIPTLVETEGWKAGLINNGNNTVTLTSTVLCVNLSQQP